MRQFRIVIRMLFVVPLLGLGVMACTPDPAIPPDATLPPPTSTPPPPPPIPPAAGCYDSTQPGVPDASFNGVLGGVRSYKNLQLFSSQSGACAGAINDFITLVQAPDLGAAFATCQAGPDPAVTQVQSVAAYGFSTLPIDGWICDQLLLNSMLQAGRCYFPNSTPGDELKFFGPRNAENNLGRFAGTTGCAGPAVEVWTVVEQSGAAAALTLCKDIDPAFSAVASFPPTGWDVPDDIWTCVV